MVEKTEEDEKASVKLSAMVPAALAAILFSSAALAGGPPKMIDTAKGKAFGDASGMAPYCYDRDKKDVSNGYDKCAKRWPPAVADASDQANGKCMTHFSPLSAIHLPSGKCVVSADRL